MSRYLTLAEMVELVTFQLALFDTAFGQRMLGAVLANLLPKNALCDSLRGCLIDSVCCCFDLFQ